MVELLLPCRRPWVSSIALKEKKSYCMILFLEPSRKGKNYSMEMRSQVTRDGRQKVLTQKRNREYFGEMELFPMSCRALAPQPHTPVKTHLTVHMEDKACYKETTPPQTCFPSKREKTTGCVRMIWRPKAPSWQLGVP